MPNTRRAFLLALAIGGVCAVMCAWPQAFALQRLPLVSNAIAFRGILVLGFAALAVVAALVALARRRWGVAAGLALALAAASLGNAAVLGVRGGAESSGDGELTVASWNTYGGSASPDDIARLVRETGADVVSLPETDAVAASQVVGILARDGIQMTSATVDSAPGGEVIPTSILVSSVLGAYALDTAAGSTPGLPSGVWRPVDGRGPVLVAAHPLPPLPGDIAGWGEGLRWVAARCAEPDAIVAGDLNATLDHFAGLGVDGGDIGGCRDAAASAGSAARGTWPVRLPVVLAAPIDHVLAGSSWAVRGFEVRTDFDGAGSDHRPIVARLSRR